MNLQELAITILSEGKFSKSLIKKAIKIVNDPKYKGGDYDHAYDAIEKLKKGLANDPEVAAALKAANEGVSVDARTKGFKAAVKRGVQASLKRKAKLEKADCDDEEDEESIEESITIEKDKKDKIYDNHIITETIGIIGHPSNTSDEYVFISKSKKYNKFDGQKFASIKEAKKWIQKSLTESVTLDEGRWAWPESDKDINKIVKVLKTKKLSYKDAQKSLFGILGDDDLWDEVWDYVVKQRDVPLDGNYDKTNVLPPILDFIKNGSKYTKPDNVLINILKKKGVKI